LVALEKCRLVLVVPGLVVPGSVGVPKIPTDGVVFSGGQCKDWTAHVSQKNSWIQVTYTKDYGYKAKISLANSWQNFPARSSKKFGRWRKNSAPH
jgi:hypothetical protein